MKIFVTVLALAAAVSCGPVLQENETVLKSVIGNFVNCMNTDLSLCLKEKALLVTERVGALRQLKLAEGLTIVNNAPEKEGRSLEPLSTDPEVRRRQVTERLSERAARLLQNTDIELSFGSDDEEQGRSVEEGRDKKKKEIKKKIKMLLPLLAILKIKAIIAITLAVILIAASLVKLAILAKIAFIVKAFFIIKELISKHHNNHEEAWIPHHEEHAGHGHGWEGGWSRSRNEGNNLAYSAYSQS